jgi:hypothetical protein
MTLEEEETPTMLALSVHYTAVEGWIICSRGCGPIDRAVKPRKVTSLPRHSRILSIYTAVTVSRCCAAGSDIDIPKPIICYILSRCWGRSRRCRESYGCQSCNACYYVHCLPEILGRDLLRYFCCARSEGERSLILVLC